MIETIATDKAPQALGPYSQALKAGGFIFCSGQIPINPATGAIEAALTALAIKESFVPATLNYENPDPECDLDYTPNVGVARDIRVALSSSLGFGGHNGILVFKKY